MLHVPEWEPHTTWPGHWRKTRPRPSTGCLPEGFCLVSRTLATLFASAGCALDVYRESPWNPENRTSRLLKRATNSCTDNPKEEGEWKKAQSYQDHSNVSSNVPFLSVLGKFVAIILQRLWWYLVTTQKKVVYHNCTAFKKARMHRCVGIFKGKKHSDLPCVG